MATKAGSKKTTKADATTTPDEAKQVKSDKTSSLKESPKKVYRIDVRSITSSLHNNHRYPGTQEMQDQGYGLYEPLATHPDLKPLWQMATSEDPAERGEFLRVMNLYEGRNPSDQTIIDLAHSIYACVGGQINPINVRDNGIKNGKQTFTLIAGHRRMMAILYLWCNGMIKAPEINACLQKGNNLSLGAMQVDENIQRKQVSPIVVAQIYNRDLQNGATIAQIAEAHAVSEATVNARLMLLELEPAEQRKVELRKLSFHDAQQIVLDRRNGGTGKTSDGLDAEQASVVRPPKGGKRNRKKGKMPTKKVMDLYKNPPGNWKNVTPEQIKFVLGVILGEHDVQGNAIAPPVTNDIPVVEADSSDVMIQEYEAVLQDGVGVGYMDELIIDEDGNVSSAK